MISPREVFLHRACRRKQRVLPEFIGEGGVIMGGVELSCSSWAHLAVVRETCANPFQVRVHAGAFSLPCKPVVFCVVFWSL